MLLDAFMLALQNKAVREIAIGDLGLKRLPLSARVHAKVKLEGPSGFVAAEDTQEHVAQGERLHFEGGRRPV